MTSLYSHKTVLPTAVDVAVHCLQLYFVLAGSQLLNLNRANKKGSSSKLQILYYIMLLFSFGFGGGGGTGWSRGSTSTIYLPTWLIFGSSKILLVLLPS